MQIGASLIFIIIFLSGPLAAQEVGVTKDKILLGQSADFEGILAYSGQQLKDGSDAYFSMVNAQGGVKGKKIELISVNDNYDGEKTQENTIDFILNKKVFALYGYLGTPNLVLALPIVQKFSDTGIFLFSSYSGAQPQRESPHNKYAYNIRSSYREEAAGLVENLVKIGKKRIALFIQFDSYGRAGASGVALELRKHNLEVVAETTYLRGDKHTVSMQEQVQAIIKARADAVISVGIADASFAFIRDARLAGLNVPIANLSPDSASLLEHVIAGEKEHGRNFSFNLINSQVVPPWTDTSYKIVREYQSAMKKTGRPMGSESLEAYLNAKIFVEILKRIKGDITRKAFHEAAKGMKDLDVGLGKSKVNFNNSANQGLKVIYFTTIKNNQFTIIKDWNDFR